MTHNVHITFTTDKPARFELIVGPDGVVLFGYAGVDIDGNQEPDLAFDTDGSLCGLDGFNIERIHTT